MSAAAADARRPPSTTLSPHQPSATHLHRLPPRSKLVAPATLAKLGTRSMALAAPSQGLDTISLHLDFKASVIIGDTIALAAAPAVVGRQDGRVASAAASVQLQVGAEWAKQRMGRPVGSVPTAVGCPALVPA